MSSFAVSTHMTMTLLAQATESVLLGESILSIREGFLWGVTEALDPEDFQNRWAALDTVQRSEFNEQARGFTSDLVRRLGERHEGDQRACTALLEWCARTKDYEAFDALLCSFEFPGKDRVLDEGRRLFPTTLTSHWPE